MIKKGEMGKFLETYSLPRLSQEETDNLNRPITRNVLEYVGKKKKKHPANESPGLGSFTEEFCQSYKEELIPIFNKLFQKTKEEGTLPKLIY